MIDPVIFEAQIIQTMAARYISVVPTLSSLDAFAAAQATFDSWELNGGGDVKTLEDAIEMVDEDIRNWSEE